MANDTGRPVATPADRAAARILPAIGQVAARLAEALAEHDVLFVASSEQRAEAIAVALRDAAPRATILHIPSSDALPGDNAPASPANIGRRVAGLRHAAVQRAVQDRARIALVSTAEAAARLYPPPAAFDPAPPAVDVGDPIDLEAFAATLVEIGYIADERVDEPGEVAVRGRVIDIFPADADAPARIELDGDHVGAIRTYDPATQRGTGEIARLEIGRVAEPPPGDDPVTLFDHLPHAHVALDPDAGDRRDRYCALVRDAVAGGERAAPIADEARWQAALGGRTTIPIDAAEDDAMPRFATARAPLRALAAFVKARPDAALILAGSERDLRFLSRRVARALHRAIVPATDWAEATASPADTIAALAMPIDQGWAEADRIVVAAADLLGSRALTGDAGVTSIAAAGLQAQESRIGDIVIHEDFGIGRIAGLEALDGDTGGDAIVLDYADGARRLVPVAEADRIWRYGADEDAVALDRLDGSSWQKRRGAIDQAIAESARALTALAAERRGRTGIVLDPPAADYERFASGFAFTETPDQARAITAVRNDLASGTPMDRLVIGDVGYGKTEVALRAAALAALAGHQVVLAAPTTVLVRQHLETFRRRCEPLGLTVAALSRLSSPAEKKAAKAGLADGSIAIVIGTGAVAGKDVRYARPALVIIDEEQRFGAADKAKLRALCETSHILTLTATPIPRTLQTALVGLQQLSVIATPPARRQPIRTTLGSFDDALVRTALLRERARGGQSFVVVSRIEDMAPMAERLARLVPELRIAQAHGKLPAKDIDEAMVAFAAGEGDVLLATNIIEAGLDVPRANTMIVWRADRFGLSQLHQLRGRVGRGSRRGQVLLLTDGEHPIAEATLKRLRTLQAFDRLGAGFAISARDLDLRGAGDLLGDAQAGHVKLIGIDLYQHLLEAALRTARGEHVDRWTPEVNVGSAGRLPESWIPEPEVRITLYGRLARITDSETLDALREELEDRFGPPPAEAQTLLAVARLRTLAYMTGIARIDAGPGAIALTPHRTFAGAPEAIGLTRKGDRLLLAERIDDGVTRRDRTEQVLEALLDAATA